MSKYRFFKFFLFGFCSLFSLGILANTELCSSTKEKPSSIIVYGDPSLQNLISSISKSFPCNEVILSNESSFQSDSLAIGALMFDKADIAALKRPYSSIELAPYAHQFHGDMMRSPVSVMIGTYDKSPILISFNKRPDTPAIVKIEKFVNYLLSPKGQKVLSQSRNFRGISDEELESERKKLNAQHIQFDTAIKPYKPAIKVQGSISSVGSDGMKSLMDQWFEDFSTLQPGTKKGQRWEHLGTLNGYHALLTQETDIAPMGRELWPEEMAAFNSSRPKTKMLEIKVAHGGFNTQQRTTVQGIFVNAGNPIQSISMDDLKKVWMDPPQITRWGQLGLTDEWENKPIALYAPPLISPNARSFQSAILDWRSFNNATSSNSVSQTSEKISNDKFALGFGGFEDIGQNASIKTVPVSATKNTAAVAASADTVANRTYPLNRYMYIRIAIPENSKLNPNVKEFLRFILGKNAQEKILYSGYYPLTSQEAEQELLKLNQ